MIYEFTTKELQINIWQTMSKEEVAATLRKVAKQVEQGNVEHVDETGILIREV